MEPMLISAIAQYGPWGISAALLVMNWFVIQKLFESLEKMGNTIATELAEMSSKLDQRRCMQEREIDNRNK